MKVNSFFCGAGGFDQGFIQAGFEIAGAWDFDKYAVESYNHNIGGAKQADVTQMKGADIPNANGWLFGFPCQDISIAGKQQGFIVECISCGHQYDKLKFSECNSCGSSDFKPFTRSGLFYEIMRLLGEVSDKPEWILAENVKAVKKFIPTIEEEYDKAGYRLVDPQLYNSKYWGVPQNRERFFLLGIRKLDAHNSITRSFTFPAQQTDFIPKLSSVLESNADEKYYLSEEKTRAILEKFTFNTEEAFSAPLKFLGRNQKELPDYALCVDTAQSNGVGFKVKQATKKGYDIALEGDSINISHPNSSTRRGRVGKQVAQTLLTGNEQVVVEPVIVHNIYGGFNEKEPRIFTEYAPTIRTAAGGGHIPSVMEMVPYRIRKLTPRETARLQGFPDTYEQIVSDTQFYKQMGNAVTVNVSHAIAKAIKEQFYGA